VSPSVRGAALPSVPMDRSPHRPCDLAPTHRGDTVAPREDPVEIAPGVWWVGVRLAHDHFQCHTYFIANGSDGVLIDPGSPLTIEGTLTKLRAITDLDAIRWLVWHHSDPQHLRRPAPARGGAQAT